MNDITASLVLISVTMVFLIGLQPVLSLQDYWTTNHPGWSHMYLYATGVFSAVIGVLFLLRRRIWAKYINLDMQEEYSPASAAKSSTVSYRARNGNTRKASEVKYPDVYYTATRPASVNIKPMLRLSTEIQSFVDRIDKYTDHLEQILQQKTTELSKNKHELDLLLGQLLPPTIALSFSNGQRVQPATFECVTVYFSDIVGYTTITDQSTALEMVEFLNTIYRITDRIVERYDAYKMETIGDADLIASGIPTPNGSKHATELAGFSLDMINAYTDFRLPHRPSETAQIRIGLHSGKCMAGIVGSRIPKYCLFGEAVSTAAKLEATSEPSKIHVSPTTAEIITKSGGFSLQKRGAVKFKNGKSAETFWLLGREN
ncbi:retinal guanylyl cyclase 1-like [Paramacrobiotus metropolitanus]|uniref:retinal guanylyl cyclase 1-like n=1 Tax=Paramacrobiotus metropolitanus TaxID=2943436 RepID=UPI002445E952|nr:retinal guanylyl cyclase 1-like [Paramacrobiotus metropolitanus]